MLTLCLFMNSILAAPSARSLSVSLLKPICNSSISLALLAPGGQQAALLSGCRALRDGRDDNACPLRDQLGTDGGKGWQNGRTEKTEK